MAYIDKAKLMQRIETEAFRWGEEYDLSQIMGDIEDFPESDVVEVKHGYDTGEDNIFHCSVCGYGVDDIYESDETNYPVWQFNFCPHCGAKMDIKTT